MTPAQHTQRTTFEPGQTFTFRKSTYLVKSVQERDGEEWVAAYRFIKTTQKYSGNAYLYRVSRLLEEGAR